MVRIDGLIDFTVEKVLDVDPGDLPLFGRVWTLRIEDEDLVLRIRVSRKVNDTKVPRVPPKEPPPKSSPPPKQPPPEKGGK